ncbi:hypothetical protein RIF29_19730 [Crotalaria pallida]|uniref:Uncharacterized protein n=1 Tax=Crotalaria pallida TaxID=3830 RepID=A0AAN9F181_CROPI
MVEAGVAMDSDTVVVDNGNTDGISASENISLGNKKLPNLALDINKEKECITETPFGPWMLVRKIPRNKDREVQKEGNSKFDSGNKKGQSLILSPTNPSGSRFNALVEDDSGELVEGNISQSTDTLHEGNLKENSESTEVGPSGGKKEINKETRIRNQFGGKNPQSHGPKNVVGPVKPKMVRGEASNAGNGPKLSNNAKHLALQSKPTLLQPRSGDTKLDKGLLNLMKALEHSGADFMDRVATKVYLPSNEALALIQRQKESIKEAVPPDLSSNWVQIDTVMDKEPNPTLGDCN